MMNYPTSWIDEDDNFHEAKCDVWDNECFDNDFLQRNTSRFQHSDRVGVSDASDGNIVSSAIWWNQRYFWKYITMQIMTEHGNTICRQ